MGYRAYSNLVYCIEVDRKDLEHTERVRGCLHDTNENANFCQECGEPIWVEETASALDTIQDGDNFNNKKLSYFVESGDAYSNPDYRFMIGFKLGGTDYNNNRDRIINEPTEAMKKQILDFIKKYKLKHTEQSIKTLIYTYHSY